MSELTDEEKRLLEGTRRRPARAEAPKPPVAQEPAQPDRGPHSPVQFDDDGWGPDTPVQMRG